MYAAYVGGWVGGCARACMLEVHAHALHSGDTGAHALTGKQTYGKYLRTGHFACVCVYTGAHTEIQIYSMHTRHTHRHGTESRS